MTMVKFNRKPFGRTFNNLVDDFITEMPVLFKDDWKSSFHNGFAPANITETENAYQLEVAAPGFEKDDFKIKLDDTVLTISVEKNGETTKEEGKTIRKEFYSRSFKRSFSIDDKVDAEKIAAKYVNGILIVTVGKKEDNKTASKDITVQ